MSMHNIILPQILSSQTSKLMKKNYFKPLFLLAILLNFVQFATAQSMMITGKIYDSQSNEPLIGATVQSGDMTKGTVTNSVGTFSFQTDAKKVQISMIGYQKMELEVPANGKINVALEASAENLQTVVVSASREAQKRTEAPVAIGKITTAVLSDAKPLSLTEVMGKISGVFMPNLQNEQHSMSIRQPLNTNPYFLYMEDGLPVRPMGLFNHNAFIETNIMAVSSIEVIKGPASSLYGPEAVGGAINLITLKPSAVPTFKLGFQGDQFGYLRTQFNAGGMITKKLGVFAGGYIARQRGSWLPQSDFDKTTINGRLDYYFSDKTSLSGTIAYGNYDSQVIANVDSTALFGRNYVETSDFMYRKNTSTRAKLTFKHTWAEGSETTISPFYRNNYYPQSPTHTVRWTTGARTAWSEKQLSEFQSYGVIAQHSQRFEFMDSKLLIGASADYSPVTYNSFRINLRAVLRPDGRSVEKYQFLKDSTEAKIANYSAKVLNTAAYAQLDLKPISNLPELQLTLGGRFDRMSFDYDNFIDKKSGNTSYEQFTPKVGLTYAISKNTGLYLNYSRGFAPPGLTSIFRLRPNPKAGEDLFYYNLTPADFTNYEIGGWASLFNNKIYLDFALYNMDARNEILSIRQPDNSTDFQSAGQTLHRGLEFGATYKPNAQWLIRFSGTNAIHRFIDFTLSNRASDAVKKLDGFDMPSSPTWITNTEVSYRPKFAKGLRVAAEWQYLSSWFQNQINTIKYEPKGFLGARGTSLLNLRTGYTIKNIELFVNVLNATDEIYANSASRGNAVNDRSTYNPGQPRTFIMGVQYNFTGRN
jgi:iron complex outermembrane recepter protein